MDAFNANGILTWGLALCFSGATVAFFVLVALLHCIELTRIEPGSLYPLRHCDERDDVYHDALDALPEPPS